MIPLILKLKKNVHKEIAQAQDLIMQEIVNVFDDAVLHGGTGIWRCYKGNRFSEDIDIYLRKDINKINLFFKNLERKGFVIEKKRIKDNSLHSTLKINGAIVRVEGLFKTINGVLREYETVEGNFITVYTLTPEDLINEKIEAYLKRLKIRDLYDIFFLLRHTSDKAMVKNSIKKLINNFKKPMDGKDLKVLILEGLVPDYIKMIDYIKQWEK